MPTWNPSLYLKFERERTQPVRDLISRISVPSPKKIIDIGCGPGNSTQALKIAYPNAEILGVDSSPEMIEKAKKKYPGLSFLLCDISSQLSNLPNDFDIVFSNACLHWVPNHHTLLPGLMTLLKPGGMLAVQMPMSKKSAVHTILQDVAKSDEWCDKIPNTVHHHLLPQDEYFDIFSENSSDFSLWETTYFHVMDSHQGILEWYRGSGMRPYLEYLDEVDTPVFEKLVYDGIQKTYPVQKNNQVIFRFRRFFFVAEK